jgi:hypothetical protein
MRVALNGDFVYNDHFSVEPGDYIELGRLETPEPTQIAVWDKVPGAKLMTIGEVRKLLKERIEWIARGRIQLLRNGIPWEGWSLRGTETLRFIWSKKVSCYDGEND